jgi:hypothetical protein
MVAHPAAWSALRACLPQATDRMFMSYLALMVVRAIEKQPWHESQIKVALASP